VEGGGAVLGAGEEGMLDGVKDQVGGDRLGGPPAQDPAAVGVDDERHAQQPGALGASASEKQNLIDHCFIRPKAPN
jgi:hypothetical protein